MKVKNIFAKKTGRARTLQILWTHSVTLLTFVLFCIVMAVSGDEGAFLVNSAVLLIAVLYVAYSFLSVRIRKLEEEREEDRK